MTEPLRLLRECEEAIDSTVSNLCDTLEYEEGDEIDDHLEYLTTLAMRCREAIRNAPDLLAALERIASQDNGYSTQNGLSDGAHLAQIARDAITKARGEA